MFILDDDDWEQVFAEYSMITPNRQKFLDAIGFECTPEELVMREHLRCGTKII